MVSDAFSSSHLALFGRYFYARAVALKRQVQDETSSASNTAMDSQLTLVTIPPPVPLTFSRNDMNHATLSLGYVPTYTITTDAQAACTELRDTGSGVLLARIIRRVFLPDTIMFPALDSGHEIKLAQWLKKTKLPDGSCAIVPIIF
ncbi:hypothetical protein K438DRAFT_1969349 [Mycena galopus ATCC 62051]|nr:hypothetical protein K438DRAFT_1969349 [Mycena galopus ATCC 62051]